MVSIMKTDLKTLCINLEISYNGYEKPSNADYEGRFEIIIV